MIKQLQSFFETVNNIETLSYYDYSKDDVSRILNNNKHKQFIDVFNSYNCDKSNDNLHKLLARICKITIDPNIINNIIFDESSQFSYYVKCTNDIPQYFQDFDKISYYIMIIINPTCIKDACDYFDKEELIIYIKFISKYIPSGIYYELLINNLPKSFQLYEIYVHIINVNKHYINLVNNKFITNEYFQNNYDIYSHEEIYKLYLNNVINNDTIFVYLNSSIVTIDIIDTYITYTLLLNIIKTYENNKYICMIILRYLFVLNPNYIISSYDVIKKLNLIFDVNLSSHVCCHQFVQ